MRNSIVLFSCKSKDIRSKNKYLSLRCWANRCLIIAFFEDWAINSLCLYIFFCGAEGFSTFVGELKKQVL